MADAELDDQNASGDDATAIADQKVINEEYKIWKKNVPFLYDMLYARALKWPTLTAQWFPDVKELDGKQEHRLLIGTNTSGQEQNTLQIAKVQIPDLSKIDIKQWSEQSNEIGGHGSGSGKDKFGWDVCHEILHPGEINKARYMPQNPDIIATWSPEDGVLVWDRTKHPMRPKDSTIRPELKLPEHKSEGFGLSWNALTQGQLATASEDGTVKLWDVNSKVSDDNVLQSLSTWTHHSGVVNDVQHHPQHHAWFATASDDLSFAICDPRKSDGREALMKKVAHTDAVNCVAIHPKWEYIVATGSADKNIAIWDLRCLDKKVHGIEAHADAVIQLSWHPQEPAILTSGSYDRRINMYDLSRVGEEQSEEEAEEGPPELLFMHGGFTNRVTEFDWNPNKPWVMLAAGEDNQLQIVRPGRALVNVPPKKTDQLKRQLKRQLNRQLKRQLNRQLKRQLKRRLKQQLKQQLKDQLKRQLKKSLNKRQLKDRLKGQLEDRLKNPSKAK
ncbi:WD40 repeat-like protein [Venturia nashicola]|uniref:WD40 repeat-like protein n=1 Tax=Venturia nashicola TaxID=86259 RepID=A0A4Z1PDG1_9PEZI|nr:WD40 repeat-like protein [Venturia nashicola]